MKAGGMVLLASHPGAVGTTQYRRPPAILRCNMDNLFFFLKKQRSRGQSTYVEP
jgi:hypothetical protein